MHALVGSISCAKQEIGLEKRAIAKSAIEVFIIWNVSNFVGVFVDHYIRGVGQFDLNILLNKPYAMIKNYLLIQSFPL
jgi:hypothetical protein